MSGRSSICRSLKYMPGLTATLFSVGWLEIPDSLTHTLPTESLHSGVDSTWSLEPCPWNWQPGWLCIKRSVSIRAVGIPDMVKWSQLADPATHGLASSVRPPSYWENWGKGMYIPHSDSEQGANHFYQSLLQLYQVEMCHSLDPLFCQQLSCQQEWLSLQSSSSLTTQELHTAEVYWISIAQEDCFPEKIEAIKESKVIRSFSPWLSLHPILDSSDILHVSGRDCVKKVSYLSQHSVILFGKHRVTKLMIHFEHLCLLHAGPTLLACSLNHCFYILGGRKANPLDHSQLCHLSLYLSKASTSDARSITYWVCHSWSRFW